MRKLCPSQFCNPTAEPFHGFHNNRSGSDEQETTELCCQQDQELRPLPAVQRIKSTAENIHHRQCKDESRQIQRPPQHQSQKRTHQHSMYPTAGAVGQGQRSASRERICLPMEINSSNRVRKSSRSAAGCASPPDRRRRPDRFR